ncbi:MAG: T9SS type A sorting domain-containing protein [Bacteroidetes bacterium]|nr:T9SS type A sorting domain-containing protein [Bacteroidota bacterium]
MNKSNLVKEPLSETGFSPNKAEHLLNPMVKIASATISRNKRITIRAKASQFKLILGLAGILICLGFAPLQSRSQSYHKLIRLNTYWDDYTYSDEPIFQNCYSDVERYYFTGSDTIIDGLVFQQSREYPFIGDPVGTTIICPPLTGIDTASRMVYYHLREDTVAKKVYINYPFFMPSTQILYDFSLSVGDTLKSADWATGGQTFVLTAIDTVFLNNGEPRRKFIFNNDSYEYYIESLGGWQGLFAPIDYSFFGIRSGTFCISENSVSLWGSDCNYYFVAINDNHPKELFTVSPNPATTEFKISLGSYDLHNIRYFMRSLTGQTILSGYLHQQKTIVSIDRLNPGLYEIQLISDEGSTEIKLVIQ